MSKKVIEDVEAEVERLLLADADADHVKYEVHERKENEESLFDDDDFMQGSEAGDTQNGEPDDLDMDAAFNEAIDEEEQESEDESNDEEAESDNENEDQQSDGDNEENETSPLKKARYGLRHEIQDLEKKVAEKNSLVTAQVNPIMKKRFEEIVSKLSAELAIKREQLEAIEQEIENEAQENAVLYLDENDN